MDAAVEVVDVAIVGYGPVGASAANLLAARGHRVAVFEREGSVYQLPRAAHLDGEVMRILQAMGVAEAVEPVTVAGTGMHFVNAAGELLFGIDVSTERREDGWAASYMFHQPELERILRARGEDHPGLSVHLRHDVEAIAQSGDTVALRVRDLRGTATRAVRARWVLGCDGGRSVTRTAIGACLEDLRCDQPWLVCDVVLRRPVDLPTMAVQYCDPARPSTFVPMPGRRRRFELMLTPGDRAEEMEEPERVLELLARWVSPGDVDLERAAIYTFHALLADRWRRGRVLLLGDAAHQMPPFLGQGMCAGIRDAANLAWKLDLVLRGRADDALLDTYQEERAPHVREIIQLAVAAGSIIQTTDPDVAAARDEHFRAGGAPPSGTGGPGLLPRLRGGFLAGTEASVGAPGPQPSLPDGRRLDDALGSGFAALAADRADLAMEPGARAWWDAGAGVVVATDRLGPWLREQQATAAVLRPDRIVYGVARGPGDLDDLTARLAGVIRA